MPLFYRLDVCRPFRFLALGLFFFVMTAGGSGGLSDRVQAQELSSESAGGDGFWNGLQVSFGADVFQLRQSEIHGINALRLLYETPSGLYIGNSVYSAAFGTGGGFFVGGIDLGWSFELSPRFGLQLGSFIGGGGGAGQITGDGLMFRPGLSASFMPFPSVGLRVQPGLSHVSVSGSGISTMAFSLSLNRRFTPELSSGHGMRPHRDRRIRITSFKMSYRKFEPQDNKMRTGSGTLQPMNLIGAEFTLGRADYHEVFIQTHGVVGGDAEGYADWTLGYRGLLPARPFRFSAALGVGTAGGGDVNTGGGMTYTTSMGLQAPFVKKFGAELEISAIRSFNGDFFVISPGFRIVRYLSYPFDDAYQRRRQEQRLTSYRWRATSGLVMHLPNSSYRNKPEIPNNEVFMIEAGIDLLLSSRTYLSGQAYTSFIGDAGGYQIGLIGLGYILPLAFWGKEDWAATAEAYIGAGGGAGVDTRGGLLTGGRVSVLIPFWRDLEWKTGIGTLATLRGGGMNPLTLHSGISIPFRSYH